MLMSNNQCIIWNTYHRYETAGQCNIEDKHCITDSAGGDIHDTLYVVWTQYATDHNMVISGGSDYHEEGKEALCLLRTRTLPTDSFQIAEILKSRDYCFDISGFIVFPQ